MDSRNIIGKAYGKYFTFSSKSTHKLANVYGYKCDIYLPMYNNVGQCNDYENVNIFSTHKNASYSSTPDATENFYIPGLIKKQIMNSYNEFETFYLDEENDRPFIECHINYELPIQTKVVVHFTEEHSITMVVEKKTGVPGSSFLRQYLIPLV